MNEQDRAFAEREARRAVSLVIVPMRDGSETPESTWFMECDPEDARVWSIFAIDEQKDSNWLSDHKSEAEARSYAETLSKVTGLPLRA